MLSQHRRSTELKAIAQHELKRPNAAVGQSGLMSLYEAMFRLGPDKYSSRKHLFYVGIYQELRHPRWPGLGHKAGLSQ